MASGWALLLKDVKRLVKQSKNETMSVQLENQIYRAVRTVRLDNGVHATSAWYCQQAKMERERKGARTSRLRPPTHGRTPGLQDLAT